jgi:hypothetical protein
MLRAILLILSAWLMLGLAPAPKARPAVPPPGDCRDDRGVDRCKAEQQRRVRELFGVKPIEAHRDAGDQVRRAFYVDGYGRDVVAITFIRPKGGDPSLWVHFPREDDVKRSEPLRAAVPLEVWESVLRRSDLFDRPLASPPTARSGGDSKEKEILVCLHSWVYTVEATDPAQGEYQPATLRSKVEDACDDGPAEAYATELTIAAVPLLPPCARLDRARHRNEATLLSACRLLRGDRLAAAEVMNRLDELRNVEGPEDLALARGLFTGDAQIDWAGELHNVRGGAAATWAKKIAEGGRTVLYYDSFEGESADRVRFVGLFSRSIEGEDKYRQARVEQIWIREDGDLRIGRAIVGPFEPERAGGGD